MNKWCAITLICLSSIRSFGDSFTNWNCRMKITAPGNRSFISVTVPKEVYQYAQDNLQDVRIADGSGNLLPYYVDQNYAVQEEETVYHETKNIGRKLSATNSAFDFQTLEMDKDFAVSQFILELSSAGFSKQIEVYSRNNSSDWEMITADSVYSMKNAVKNDIRLEEPVARHFFRFVIKDNPELIAVTKCTLTEKKPGKASLIQSGKIDLDFQVSNTGKSSVLKIKNPYHLRVVRLDVPLDGNFQRNYELHTLNIDDLEEFIISGVLFQLELKGRSSTNTAIVLDRPLRFDTALLSVQNGDNNPLAFKRIKAEVVFDRLIFERSGEGPFFMYFGNTEAEKPEFDIQNYKDSVEKEEKDAGALSDLSISSSKGKFHRAMDFKLLFNILIALVSIALVVFLVVKLLKK